MRASFARIGSTLLDAGTYQFGLTRFVDRLEEAGYVVRESCPDDRRGFDVRLTEKGQAALREAWPVYERVLVEAFDVLDEGEARALANMLSDVAVR